MGAVDNRSLFFIGISAHLMVSWIITGIFMFIDSEKHGDKVKK